MKLLDYEKLSVVLRVLITGMSGSGKSTLAATLSKHFNVIWIDIENAVDTLTKLPAEQKSRIKLIKIPDSASFPIAAQTIQKLFKDKKGKICDKHGVISCSNCLKDLNASYEEIDFTTLNPKTDIVVLDSLTQLGFSFMSHLTKNKPVDYKPERDDWGGLRKNCEYFISNLQAADFNLVCTALPIEVELEDGRTKLIPQFGSASMCQAVGAKFGTIIYTDIKNKKHVAFSSSTATSTVLTKSRSDFKLEDLSEPDLCPMFLEHLGISPSKSAAQTAFQSLKQVTVPGFKKQ